MYRVGYIYIMHISTFVMFVTFHKDFFITKEEWPKNSKTL